METKKLWLWKNFVDGRPEYWAFDNPYPCKPGPGDPMVIGEPCGYALFKESTAANTHVPEDDLTRACANATARVDAIRAQTQRAQAEAIEPPAGIPYVATEQFNYGTKKIRGTLTDAEMEVMCRPGPIVAVPCVVVTKLQISSDIEDSMPTEPGYNDTAFVPREQQPHYGAPRAWHVVDKDGNFARNGFTYEYSKDLVTRADVDWPANSPHRAIPLFDQKAMDAFRDID